MSGPCLPGPARGSHVASTAESSAVVTDHIPDQGFRVSSRDGVPVVTAPGEIDAANAEALDDALAAASADHPTIIVDMTRNVFCDSSGLRVLIMASNAPGRPVASCG
jgi:hypothetical protein